MPKDVMQSLESLMGIKGFFSNLSRLHKDVVSTELEDWLKRNRVKPKDLYGVINPSPNAPVLIPDGMKGLYRDIVPQLVDLLSESDFDNTIKSLLQVFKNACDKLNKISHAPEGSQQALWDHTVLNAINIEHIKSITEDLKIFLLQNYQDAYHHVAMFHKEFRKSDDLELVLDKILQGHNLIRKLDDRQNDIAKLHTLSARLVGDLKTLKPTSSVLLENVTALISSTARYLDMTGVVFHEIFKIDHNLKISLDNLYKHK